MGIIHEETGHVKAWRSVCGTVINSSKGALLVTFLPTHLVFLGLGMKPSIAKALPLSHIPSPESLFKTYMWPGGSGTHF